MKKTLIYAHRGASFYALENTMEAFGLAVEMGADGIELDVRLSADGQVVVFHDETLERVCGNVSKCSDMTLSQLKQMSFIKAQEPYKNARIPALRELYDMIKSTKLLLNVELKEDSPKLAEALVRLEKEYKLSDRIMYSSFKVTALDNMRERIGAERLAFLYSHGLMSGLRGARLTGAKSLNPHWKGRITAIHTRLAQLLGYRVNVWTVDRPEQMRIAIKSGINGLITNRPDVAARIRTELNTI